MRIERATQVEGLWGYEQLARLPLPNSQLALLIVGTSLFVHGVIAVFFAQLEHSSAYSEILTQTQLQIWILCLGFLTGIMINAPISGSLWVRKRVVKPLSAIDPAVAELGGELRPRAGEVFVTATLLTVIVVVVIQQMALRTTGFDIFDVALTFEQGTGAVISNLIVGPFCLFVMNIALATSNLGGVRHGLAMARSIRIDILRVEDYAPIADNAVSAFVMLCVILSVGGFFSLIVHSEQLLAFLLAGAAIAVIFTLVIGVRTIQPVLVLAGRFREAINEEKLRVLALVDSGDPALLAETRPGWKNQPSQGELVAYLSMLKQLSPWPIGASLRTLILFGLLPPASWFLAATVENLAY